VSSPDLISEAGDGGGSGLRETSSSSEGFAGNYRTPAADAAAAPSRTPAEPPPRIRRTTVNTPNRHRRRRRRQRI